VLVSSSPPANRRHDKIVVRFHFALLGKFTSAIPIAARQTRELKGSIFRKIGPFVF
jgi:hypothetical protein